MRSSQIKAEDRHRVSEILDGQNRRMLELILESDSLLTRYIFLTNAGGAVAMLTFIGTKQASSSYEWLPLVCFVLGVIASGVEVRALAIVRGGLQRDLV